MKTVTTETVTTEIDNNLYVIYKKDRANYVKSSPRVQVKVMTNFYDKDNYFDIDLEFLFLKGTKEDIITHLEKTFPKFHLDECYSEDLILFQAVRVIDNTVEGNWNINGATNEI